MCDPRPGLSHAAQLGIRSAIPTSDVRHLETIVGIALLRTGPDVRLTLTAYGQPGQGQPSPAIRWQLRDSLDE